MECSYPFLKWLNFVMKSAKSQICFEKYFPAKKTEQWFKSYRLNLTWYLLFFQVHLSGRFWYTSVIIIILAYFGGKRCETKFLSLVILQIICFRLEQDIGKCCLKSLPIFCENGTTHCSQCWDGCAPILPSWSIARDSSMAHICSIISISLELFLGTCNAGQETRSAIFWSFYNRHQSVQILAWSACRSGTT